MDIVLELEHIRQLEQEIRNISSELQSSVSDIGDWKIAKYQEYMYAGKDAPYDITELNYRRQLNRDRIAAIQTELAELGVSNPTKEPTIDYTLEQLKSFKIAEVQRAFQDFYNNKAELISSLGVPIDSDIRAKQDVDGLIDVLEATGQESTMFRCADNSISMLTLDQLKTLRLEIIQNGQHAYQHKWATEAAIESAQTKEELAAIEIEFTGLDFSSTVEA